MRIGFLRQFGSSGFDHPLRAVWQHPHTDDTAVSVVDIKRDTRLRMHPDESHENIVKIKLF